MTLLDAVGLRRHFAGVKAVDDVSLSIEPGEVVSVIGPNGSGKTTLLNLVSGLLRPDAGTVRLHGQDVTGWPAHRLAEAGLARTFQNGRVFGNLTVAENVALGRNATRRRPFPRLRHIPGARWVSLLAETGAALLAKAPEPDVTRELDRFGTRLAPRADDPAYSLSYANRRRTEIARALAADPTLLVLDEPTAGMNPTETAELLETLLALKADGRAMLVVEHKIDLVSRLSDRVVVLDAGRVIATGAPADVRADERVIAAYLGRRRTGAPE